MNKIGEEMRQVFNNALAYAIVYTVLSLLEKHLGFETAVFFSLAYLMAQDAMVEIIKDIKK